jgi:hypothetical protein
MGIVTTGTIAGYHRLMRYLRIFYLGNKIGMDFLVAFETESRGSFGQLKFGLRTVGIMAGRAFPFGRFMSKFGLKDDLLFFVAGKADRFGRRGKLELEG